MDLMNNSLKPVYGLWHPQKILKTDNTYTLCAMTVCYH